MSVVLYQCVDVCPLVCTIQPPEGTLYLLFPSSVYMSHAILRHLEVHSVKYHRHSYLLERT